VRHLVAAAMSASLALSGMAAVGLHPIAPAMVAQAIQSGEPTSVNVPSLTVRSAPGLDADVNAYLPFGTDVVVVGGPVAADGYDWYQLHQGGLTIGWSVQGFSLDSAPNALGTLATAGSSQSIQGGSVGSVDVDSLVVRADPSLSGTVIGSLPFGTNVVVLDGPVSADGYDWYRLQTDVPTIGWSVEGFIAIEAPSDPTADTGGALSASTADTGSELAATTGVPAAETVFTVTAGFLDVRSDPSVSAGIARIVTHGTELTQAGESVELGGLLWFPVDGGGWVGGQRDGLSEGLFLERYPLYVSADELNVRSSASMSGRIVQSLAYGDTVNVFDSTQDKDGVAWSAVNEAGTLWVATEYLTVQL
jgi:hypothetical protein